MNDKATSDDQRRARLGAPYEEGAAAVQVGQGYSRLVKSLRVVLPLMAVGIIAVLFLSSERDTPALPIEEIKTPSITDGAPVIEKNELVAPHFESETKDGKKYNITATRAVQELRQPDLILMEAPRGVLETDTAPLNIMARDGTYNQKTQFMTLNEDIEISQEGTGTILLKTLEADLNRGEMTSPHMVRAVGSYGTLEADSLRVTHEGLRVILAGPVRIELKEGFESWFE